MQGRLEFMQVWAGPNILGGLQTDEQTLSVFWLFGGNCCEFYLSICLHTLLVLISNGDVMHFVLFVCVQLLKIVAYEENFMFSEESYQILL